MTSLFQNECQTQPIIDIGIAVKKILTMQQKYVLPERTWNFFPFSDETARAEQRRAIVPANI